MDSRFRVDLISATPNPQQVYVACTRTTAKDSAPATASNGRMRPVLAKSVSNVFCW